MALADSKITEELQTFLETNLPKKKKSFALACLDKNLAGSISQALGIETKTNEIMNELFRGIRVHFHDFLKVKGNFF